ncbi:MAG: NUDIX domain-containing protein [Candidatus Staskawiczbacteria bacterium]|nr:NUDIX domain-containing protein [Candidatus Staskawiczbacteria bacterium]
MLTVKKPDNFHSDFQAVGCFVEVQGSILQLLRTKISRGGPLKWGSPGGKIEPGESAEMAMVRELKEEIGLAVSERQLQRFPAQFVVYPDCAFEYAPFKLVFPFRPEIALSHEHIAYVWLPVMHLESLALMQDQFESTKLVYQF